MRHIFSNFVNWKDGATREQVTLLSFRYLFPATNLFIYCGPVIPGSALSESFQIMDTQDLQRLKNKFDIIGDDAALNHALEMAVAVGPTDLTVLVTGESGVGKDVVPKIIHQNSLRKSGKYLAVNCAAIPEGTVDSELFGHEKGSFTGAVDSRKGYFEEADGGTLFLDEIGELPLATQAKLLRVLQSGEYIRVGSSKVGKTNVRLIAATNVNLQESVARGKFRQDLYYRLSSIQITLPPLRERNEDTYLLFRKFTSDFSEKYGWRKVNLTRDAVELLKNYRWPGNIRELQSVANSVSLFESSKVTPSSGRVEIDAKVLSKYLGSGRNGEYLPAVVPSHSSDMTEEEKTLIFDRLRDLELAVRQINNILKGMGGDVKGTAHTTPTYQPHVREDHQSYSAPAELGWVGTDRQEDVDFQDGVPYERQAPPKASSPMARDISYSDVDDQTHLKDAETSLSIRGMSEEYIRKALEKYHGNRKKAAAELGISERTLYRRLPEDYRKDKKN